MLTVVGDVIEYDGKPFAIITAPLSGWRMDAIDMVRDYDIFLEDVVSEIVSEERSDDKLLFADLLDRAEKEIWLPETYAEWLRQEITDLFKE